MSRRLAMMVEAEKRGLLAGRDLAMLRRARAEGLLSEPKDPMAEAVRHSSDTSAQMGAAIQAIVQQMAGRESPTVTVETAAPTITVDVPQQAAPVINVQPSAVTVAAPVVHVAAPVIPESQVVVHVVEPERVVISGWDVEIRRDKRGEMTGFNLRASK